MTLISLLHGGSPFPTLSISSTPSHLLTSLGSQAPSRAFGGTNVAKACHVLLPSIKTKARPQGLTAPRGRLCVTKCISIVFVSAEVAPWSKTGGLGDVVGGLPIELAKRGHRVMSVAPRYDQYEDAWDTGVVLEIEGETVRFFHTRKEGVDRIWVDHPSFLAKVRGKTGAKLYGAKSGADYNDNPKRFMLFCRAALEALVGLPMSFGEGSVIVANDWHSAMVPVLIKGVYQPQGRFLSTKTALCIHNIAYQGRFRPEVWPHLRLPDNLKSLFSFEDGYPRTYTEDEPDEEEELQPRPKGAKYQKINWLKAGIKTADKVLTVSPNYAAEITAGEDLGVELDNVLREAGGVEGIVNGMDTNDWSPENDKFIMVRYSPATMDIAKRANKAHVQAELGLPEDASAPLFCFIGRLEEQKGVDILVDALAHLKGQKLQVAILGTGKASLEKKLQPLPMLYPGLAAVELKFDTALAHKLFAGADYMLVPSRFEPCGLIQLQAMQYGTVPIVASTGGLVDTVKEGVTGFHMGAFDTDKLLQEDAEALAATVMRAVEVYPTQLFAQMRLNAIKQDLSWSRPAKMWEATLEALFSAGPDETVLKGAIVPKGVPANPNPASIKLPAGLKPAFPTAASPPAARTRSITAAAPSSGPTPVVLPTLAAPVTPAPIKPHATPVPLASPVSPVKPAAPPVTPASVAMTAGLVEPGTAATPPANNLNGAVKSAEDLSGDPSVDTPVQKLNRDADQIGNDERKIEIKPDPKPKPMQ